MFLRRVFTKSVASCGGRKAQCLSTSGGNLKGSSQGTVCQDDIANIIEKRITNVVPKKFNFARDVVDYWAEKERRLEKDPSHPALHVVGLDPKEERKMSYVELSQLSQQLAGAFVNELGMTRDNRILVCLSRSPEFWIVTLAALRAGIEFTTVTPQSLARDIMFRTKEFRPTLVVSNKTADVDAATDFPDSPVKFKISVENSGKPNWIHLPSLLNKSAFAGADTLSDEVAMVFFTSGTTGAPKMVEHDHGYTLGHIQGLPNLLNLKSSDSLMCTADTGWVKTAFGTYALMLAGCSLVIDTTPKFNPQALVKIVESYPITKISSAPTAFRMMMHGRPNFKFPALDAAYAGGESLSAETFNEWKRRTGTEIREGFGQTETLMVCTNPPHIPPKPGSMGMPVPEYEVEVLDDDMKPLGPGKVGHLGIKITPKHPLGLFKGYKNNPKKTAETFAGDYYLTGDKVHKDEDNYYWFSSRSDDVINSSGYRIGPYEIESIIWEHPGVLEAVVVGSPDKERQEIVKAFVVLKEDFKGKAGLEKEIQEFVKKRTAPYKYPREVEFRDALPKTISGKVQRHLLRKDEQERKKAS